MPSQTLVIEFPSLKKTRRYGAKVRTGCITCKLRRVRCDEGKPSCRKCTSTGRHCDGYAQENRPVKLQQARALKLTQSSVVRYSTPLPSVPILSVSGDGIQYLEFYHHCAGQTLSSRFDANFWQRIAPQMAQTEPSVRHALIALGYLTRSETGSIKHATSSGDNQHGLLFFHYNNSVRHLIERMDDASYTPEVGLVTCLLFICIEFLRANFHTGFTHLWNGLKVISDWHQDLLGNKTSLQTSKPSISAITRTAFDSGSTMKDIVPMFFRTITCALLMGEEVEKIIGMPVSDPRVLELRPFSDVYDARTACLQFQNAALAFITSTAPRSFPPPKIRPKTLRLQQSILENHRSWWRAFEGLSRSTQLSPADKIIESELKAGYHCTFIGVACVTSVQQTPYDVHLEGFKAIVHHVNRVFDSQGLPKHSTPSLSEPLVPQINKAWTYPACPPPLNKPVANFTFEVMLLPVLYLTVQRCRCPTTRREALAQMERNAPREALWDHDQHALVSRRLIEIEEEEVDPVTGWPVEDSRLWCAVVEGAIDTKGGFWVNFAKASWVLDGARRHEEVTGGLDVDEDENYPGFRKRGDNQWQEWFGL